MARILVIEDKNNVIVTCKNLLEKEGYSYIIQGAEDFESAITLVKESVPDLIILDIDTKGIIDLKRILITPETESIPVIVIVEETGNLGRLSCIAALWYGACDYLLKPIKDEDLVYKVQFQMRLS